MDNNEEQKTDVAPTKNKGGRPFGTVKVKDRSSFLKQGKHELDDSIRKLKREAEEAVQILMGIAKDKTADVKERRQAASSVLDHLNKMVDQRNKDELTRKIAEYRIRGASGNFSAVPAEAEDEDDTPILEFDKIPKEFEDVDLSIVENNT